MNTQIQRLDAARSGAGAATAVDYATFPNAMPASREVAPRLGHAYAVGTAGQKEVYECMKELGYQMGEAEAVRTWNAIGLMLKDRMPRDGRAYDIGFVRFFPAIEGTFPSADAGFDPERNRLYVAAAPSEELRNALADGTPTRIGGPAANDTRITNVTWGNGTEANTVKSDAPLDIRGYGLTIGVGDEHAELELPEGDPVAVTLSAPAGDAGLAQRLVGRLAVPVAACEGATLWVWTHGFNPSAALRKVASAKLTVIAGTPAPIAFDFAQTEGVNEGQVNETADTLLHVSEGCEIPTWGEGDSITLTGRGQTWTMPTPVVDTESMTYGFQIPQDVGGTLEEDDSCEFNIRSGGRTGTLAAVWKH